MANNFGEYKLKASKLIRHKKHKVTHILLERAYQNFKGFSEVEIWGNLPDFDYEKWIKEQN